MTRPILSIAFAFLFASAALLQDPEPDYASPASRVLATHQPAEVGIADASRVAKRAAALIESLDEPQRQRMLLALDDPERRNWTNVPPSMDERGLRLGDMSSAQLQLALDFLAGVLSEEGYAQARDIMLGDDLLLRGGRPRNGFGVANYWLIVFGTPSPEQRWGIQLDGHHLALNLTLEGSKRTMSPSFIGTQPAEFDYRGIRKEPMGDAVGAAFDFVQSLDEQQRERAVRSGRRGDLLAGPGRDGLSIEIDGLACSDLNEGQREILLQLIASYEAVLPEPFASQRVEHLRGDIDGMVFAWDGPTEDGSDVSFHLVGSCVLIEYACQDLGGDPLQHLHSMYRNPQTEYGE